MKVSQVGVSNSPEGERLQHCHIVETSLLLSASHPLANGPGFFSEAGQTTNWKGKRARGGLQEAEDHQSDSGMLLISSLYQ